MTKRSILVVTGTLLLAFALATFLVDRKAFNTKAELNTETAPTTAHRVLRASTPPEASHIIHAAGGGGHGQHSVVAPFLSICPSLPYPHPILHDQRQEEVEEYEANIGHQSNIKNQFDDELVMHVFEGSANFLLRSTHKRTLFPERSAWNETFALPGPGYDPPPPEDGHKLPIVKLQGDWVVFTSWINGGYGHFAHDWLPTIAYLRNILPETTRFLLPHSDVSRANIDFIDHDFYMRIFWIDEDTIYHIQDGSLTVPLPPKESKTSLPHIVFEYVFENGCCSGFDPMRRWIAEKRPHVPAERHVVFYSRAGSDTRLGRKLEAEHEQEVLRHIQQAMDKYGIHQKIVVFNGQDPHGGSLNVAHQFQIFRAASAIIGPHGSGMGGNFVWTDPYPQNCNDRVKLLEFIPGRDSAHVHFQYMSHFFSFRKWPFDYHAVFYTADSTSQTTYVNLQDLDNALDAMWGPAGSGGGGGGGQ